MRGKPSCPRPGPTYAEEDEAVPARSGDRPGDSGQGAIRAALPLIPIVAHRHGVFDALVLPDQPCPGDGPVVDPGAADDDVAAVQLFSERLEPGDGLGFQPPVSEFLDSIRQTTLQPTSTEPVRLH